jgi:type VI secretion system secreted protein Hcp
MAQADMFLKLHNIKGESTDAKHKGEIEVLSYSWTGTQSGTGHVGTGSGAGKVAIGDLQITKYVDSASPQLFQFLTKGDHIAEGLLTCRKAGGEQLEYLKLKMEQVFITSVSVSGSQGHDSGTESVSLNFRKFTQTYTPQDEKGKPKTPVDFKWDIARASES